MLLQGWANKRQRVGKCLRVNLRKRGIRLIRKANEENLRKLYKEHMEKDFPAIERPPFAHFLKLTEEEMQDVLIYSEDGRDVAYCVTAIGNAFVLISFLAVYEEFRGKGVGSQMLTEVKEFYSDKAGFMIEVEKPEAAKNEAERKLRERRIAFYERCGFFLLEKIEYLLWKVPFFIMVTEKKFGEAYIAEELRTVYQKLLRPEYRDMLQISVREGEM